MRERMPSLLIPKDIRGVCVAIHSRHDIDVPGTTAARGVAIEATVRL
jgi:hypothetical protein